MSKVIKRKEGLRKGLARISEERLQEVLKVTNREGLTAEPVHEVRKTIKSLRATLRLTRGAMAVEARKRRNGALRELAERFSGPRDAVVVLSAFQKSCAECLNADRRSAIPPPWESQMEEPLMSRANALLPAESYRDAAEEVRRLAGQILPFRHDNAEGEWKGTIEEGLGKTYARGRRLLHQLSTTPEPSDGQYHELRKRAKDLGYQLSLLKRLKGVRPLLDRLDKLGGALGDARDLFLLRDYLNKARAGGELSLLKEASFRRLLTYVDQRRGELYKGALKAAKRVYPRGKKRFLRWMERNYARRN